MRYPRVPSLAEALGSSEVSFGAVTYAPGATFGPRVQRTVQLVLVHDGSAVVSIDGQRIQIGSGAACLLLPGPVEHFSFSPTRQTTHSWVHYWSAPHDLQLLDRLQSAPRVQRASPALSRMLNELLADPEARRGSDPVTVLRCYAILYRYLLDGRSEEKLPPSLGAAVAFIEQHLTEHIDLARIAAAAATSRSQLFRLFRERLGVTPANYVWGRRVELAVELLSETGLPVGEIARRCGFRTAKHLSRRVRQATGKSPVGLRAAAQLSVDVELQMASSTAAFEQAP